MDASMPLCLAKIQKNSRSLSVFSAQKPTGQRKHAVLAPRLSPRRAVLGWAQGNHDPGLGVTAIFIWDRLDRAGEKIPFMNSVNWGEDSIGLG
jgi:hypothetical protein